MHASDLPFVLLLVSIWLFVGLAGVIGWFAVIGWVSTALAWVVGWSLRLDLDADPALPRPRGLTGWMTAWGLLLTRGATYAMGMSWGAVTGWRQRRVRLIPLPVVFRRFNIRGGGPARLLEDTVFHIGSWSKEVPASA
jgi:hypothetical protein